MRPEGANHQWRRNPPRELSIDLVADERLGRVTGRAGALRAAKAAGVEVGRITVDKDGRIILELVTAATGKQAAATPLDEWLAAHAS